jgi:dihydroorotase
MIVRNCRIVSPQGIFDSSVRFGEESGIIEEIGPSMPANGEEEYDAGGAFLLPGLIDVHCHLRDPGFTAKEDFLTGTTAALAGGVTTVFDMPNTSPPTTSLEALNQKAAIAAEKAVCDYGLVFGAAIGNEEESLKAVPQVAAKKIFIGGTTSAEALASSDVPAHFSYPKPVMIHAEDAIVIGEAEKKYRESLGSSATAAEHNSVRPPEAAVKAVELGLSLAEKARCHLHVCHVSTASELELIRAAKARGVNVSCEATPHHLFLDESACKRMGSFAKVNPPLRSAADSRSLWEGIADGTIDLIASDHAPHLPAEKERGYWEAPSGVPGLETTLPLLLDAVLSGRLTLEKVVELCCYNPARKFGLRHKGAVETGFDADFVLVDMAGTTLIENSGLYTKCGWSPFDGARLNGKINAVFLRGKLVKEGEHLVAKPGTGKNQFALLA